MSNQGIMILIALVAIGLVVTVISQVVGQTTRPPDPTEGFPSSSCDLSQFSREYFNDSYAAVFPPRFKIDGRSYAALNEYRYGLVLPIEDGGCRLLLNTTESNRVFETYYLWSGISSCDSETYSDISLCHSVSGGSDKICSATSSVGNAISSPGFVLAAQNEKTTLNIVRTLAPYGVRAEADGAAKLILRTGTSLSERVPGLMFEVTNTYTCVMSSAGEGVRIYDYSIVGNDILKRMRQQSYYTNGSDILLGVNKDLKTFLLSSEFGNMVSEFQNSLGGALLNPDKCKLFVSKQATISDLDCISSAITNAKSSVNGTSSAYFRFIEPYKANATLVRSQYVTAKDALSIGGFVRALFLLHKSPEYINTVLTQMSADNQFEKGLFISSSKHYIAANDAFERWNTASAIDWIIGLVILLILAAVWVLFFGNNNNYSY